MSSRREIYVLVVIIGGFAAYWISSEVFYARSISPDGILNVRDFFDRFGEPERIDMVQRDGQRFFEFTGHRPGSGLMAFPSARPAYLFDEQGRFTTWCRDPGDSQGYRSAWPLQSSNQVDVHVVKHKFGL